MHDGGLKTQLLVDGKPTCDNFAKYGGKPEFVSPPMPAGSTGHSHGGATKHISDMNVCFGKEGFAYPQMKKGQVWTLKSVYDFDQNLGMKRENGDWDEVMGIEIMFVRKKGA